MAALLLACGAKSEYITREAPLLYVDDEHPTPAWIRKLRSQPLPAQREAFRHLSLADRIEYAAFEQLGEHPPLLTWMTLLARDSKIEDAVPILRTKIEGERSDAFVTALVSIFENLSPLMSPSDLTRMDAVSRARVARISNVYSRLDAERTLDEIPAFIQAYREAHK